MRDLCAASSHFIFKSRIKRKEEGKKKGHGSTRRICIHQSSTWARDEALSLGLNKLLEGKGNKKKGKLSDKKSWPFLWLDGGSSVCSGTGYRSLRWTTKKYLRWREMWGFIQTQAPRPVWSPPKVVTLSSHLQNKWQRCWKILELADEQNLQQIQLLSSLR